MARDGREKRRFGLVRVRDANMELWLAMVGDARHDVGVHPRHVNLGTDLSLPVADGLTFQLVTPAGQLTRGSLATKQRFAMDEQGEWLTVISDAQGRVAAWPTYVGILPPSENLLDEINVTSSQQPELDVLDALNEVREIYGVQPWTRTPVLDALAATLHEDNSRDLNTLGVSVGYRPGAVHAWSCQYTSTMRVWMRCSGNLRSERPARRWHRSGCSSIQRTTDGVTLMGVAANE